MVNPRLLYPTISKDFQTCSAVQDFFQQLPNGFHWFFDQVYLFAMLPKQVSFIKNHLKIIVQR